MPDEAELVDLLEQIQEDNQRAEVRVSQCEYRCCGGGWQLREGEQTYIGQILAINVESVLLQVGSLGKIQEVMADHDRLLTVRAVD